MSLDLVAWFIFFVLRSAYMYFVVVQALRLLRTVVVFFNFKLIFAVVWFAKAYTSVNKAALSLRDNQNLARIMNSVIFHCRVVDDVDELVYETSDLSTLW